MRLNVSLYRAMAYVTGVVLIVLCVLAILQPFAAVGGAVHAVGLTHGLLYVVYLVAGYTLSRRLRLAPRPTVMVLLAGTIPVLTFVVERHITHRYIEPAFAGEEASRRAAADPAPGAQGGVSDAQPAR